MSRVAYVFVVAGGLVFALGALGFLYVTFASEASESTGRAAIIALGTGAGVLGVGWIGVLRRGRGGFGAIAGSFAVPLALIYARTHTNESVEDLKVTTLIALFALAFFALGHAFARGSVVVRIVAGVTSLFLGIQAIAIAADHVFSRDTDRLLSFAAMLGLASLGLTIAIAGFDLRKAPADDLF